MRQMKDSGIEWIGEIPQTWGTLRLKYCLIANDGGVWGIDPIDESEAKIVLRSTEQTIDGQWCISDPATRNLTGINLLRYRIKPHDLLITKSSGSSLHIGKTTIADSNFKENELYYSNFLQRLRVDDTKLVPRMAWYLLNASFIRAQFVYLQNSTSGLGNINSSNIDELVIPKCPLAEQERIAEFLDAKCAEVDALAGEIKEQIATLEEYKRSVITEAVTKGLDTSVPMKDSGIEWMGEIPQAWDVRKGKYLFAQRNERGNNVKLQLLSPTQNYGVIPQDEYERLSGMSAVKLNENINLKALKTIHKGDYCISLRSFQGGFEYSMNEGVISPAYQVFYPTVKISGGYYKYLFKDKGFISVINSYAMSLRDGKNISFEQFGNTVIPVPPLAEQERIAEFLDAKCAEVDALIAEKQNQLSTLEEYKKSVIFEYVTGKKEVV